MNSKRFRDTLVVATASVMAVFAVGAAAQAPAGGPPRGGGMGMGMGMMGPQDRPGTIERMGLNDPALKLTAAQKAEIDKIVDGYIAEQKTLAEKYPMTPGSPPSQDAMQARRSARDNLNTALGKVLNDEQRKSWEAAQAARRPPMGGPGGPPPGNR
jgi:Spy/CpxP family protein refolding chaperone